eukprot:10154498-Alexandrium_andersonii.AAC.1
MAFMGRTHPPGHGTLWSKRAILPETLPGRSRSQVAQQAKWPLPRLGIRGHRSTAFQRRAL